jgi:hypothetical protein
MNTVSRIFRKISGKIDNYFFEDRYTAHGMVTLRIGVCFILLLQCILLRHDIMAMIQANGVIRQELIVSQLPWYCLTSSGISEYISTRFGLSEIAALHLMGGVYVTAIIAVLFGLFTRISAAILWLLHISFMSSGYYFIYGMDYFLTIMLFYIIIFPTQHELSVDKYLFRLKTVNYTPYIRILQIHLSLVYFISGFAKVVGGNWWNGISIVKALVRPGESMLSNTVGLGSYQWLFVAAGIGTMVVEMCYPIFINIQKTRKVWLFFTYMMHLSIAIFLNLPLFAATMVLFNIAAFYYPVRAAMKTESIKPAPQPELQIA